MGTTEYFYEIQNRQKSMLEIIVVKDVKEGQKGTSEALKHFLNSYVGQEQHIYEYLVSYATMIFMLFNTDCQQDLKITQATSLQAHL